MEYEVYSSDKFKRQLFKFVKQNPKLRNKITRTLVLLSKNPNHPSLRLHKLSGQEDWSISVNMKTRIIVGMRGNIIHLMKIGTHDEVYD